MTFVCNVMLYLLFIGHCLYCDCGQLSKKAVHLNSHKDAVFSCPSEFVPPRKPCKTGLHENTSPFSAVLELRNSQCADS